MAKLCFISQKNILNAYIYIIIRFRFHQTEDLMFYNINDYKQSTKANLKAFAP